MTTKRALVAFAIPVLLTLIAFGEKSGAATGDEPPFSILGQAQGPIAGQTFHLTMAGNPDLVWTWDITNGYGSGGDSSSSSPAFDSIDIPPGSGGETLTVTLQDGMCVLETKNWTIGT